MLNLGHQQGPAGSSRGRSKGSPQHHTTPTTTPTTPLPYPRCQWPATGRDRKVYITTPVNELTTDQ